FLWYRSPAHSRNGSRTVSEEELMVKLNLPGTGPVYAAAERWRKAALATDDSLFTPGHPIWSAPVIEELHEQFVGDPQTTDESFKVKFQRQLADASRPTIQLAGELLFVHFLIVKTRSGNSERRLIDDVLQWPSSPPAPL